MNSITCTAKEALELLQHMKPDDMVTVTINNTLTYKHTKPVRIKKKKGEELINEADNIEYQDNDYFGRLSLYGITTEKEIIHNILFPQLE